MAVEDTNDLYPRLGLPIDYQMRTTGMNPHRRRKLGALAGHFRKLDQKIEQREESVGIVLCLLDTPSRGALQPDLRKVRFSSRPKNPAATFRHALRASGP